MVPSPHFSKKSQRSPQSSLEKKIQAQAERKLKARKHRKKVLFGLGMFGVVGWSVSIPTLLGLALGLWLDKTFPSQYSWTLMMLLVGVILGCLNAWYWVQKESSDD